MIFTINLYNGNKGFPSLPEVINITSWSTQCCSSWGIRELYNLAIEWKEIYLMYSK